MFTDGKIFSVSSKHSSEALNWLIVTVSNHYFPASKVCVVADFFWFLDNSVSSMPQRKQWVGG